MGVVAVGMLRGIVKNLQRADVNLVLWISGLVDSNSLAPDTVHTLANVLSGLANSLEALYIVSSMYHSLLRHGMPATVFPIPNLAQYH